MDRNDNVFASPASSARSEEVSKVLRNTYALLAMTLVFSGVMAFISMSMHVSHMVTLGTFIAAFVLMIFVMPKTANSSAGLGVIFLITGLLGFSIGPMLSHYLSMNNGGQLVMTALGGTGIIFFALSAYALTTKKDFSFLGGMLGVGLLVAVLAIVANIFMQIPALSLTISAVVILLMSGFILYDTGRIINGGERNYIMATMGLYLNIFNIFTNLLSLLGFSADD